LSLESDSNHQTAVQIAASLETSRTQLVTTRAVLLGIGNALSKQRFRNAAVRLLTALENDATVDIVETTREHYLRAFQLFQDRADKDWGMIDCMSFIVMGDLGLTEALTADVHFQQAGFTPLLRRQK
jgi:predicted nucleic acid-binding protein